MHGDTSANSGADAKPDAKPHAQSDAKPYAQPYASPDAKPDATNVSGRDVHCGFWVRELLGWQVLCSGSGRCGWVPGLSSWNVLIFCRGQRVPGVSDGDVRGSHGGYDKQWCVHAMRGGQVCLS